MAYSPISSLPLGKIVQIAFDSGIRNQISEAHRSFEMIKKARVSSSVPRSIRFYFQSSLLPSNVQWRDPGTQNRSFPNAFQPLESEYEAQLKEVNASLELEYNLYQAAKKSPEKYAEPLQNIINSATISTKREMARALWLDGTGVIGTLPASSAAVTSPASNQLVFTLDEASGSRGHVGTFEYNEIYILKTAAGAATALDTNLGTEPVYWQCVLKDRAAGTVTLKGLDSSFAAVASMTVVNTPPEDNSVFYKYNQPTIPDLTAIVLGTTDYGTISEMMAGMPSLAASDGRVMHGITMSGATGASSYNAGGNPLDLSHFNGVMDLAKIEVGSDRYSWKQAIGSPEAQSGLIESRETDRRFISWQDNLRGTTRFGVVHRNDKIELVDDEYVAPTDLWIMPESKSGQKVLEYHGSDFETVQAGADSDGFQLKVASGQYVNTMISYLFNRCVLINKHPKSCARIYNFS